MSKIYALQATKRDGVGKGAAREIRRNGDVPAVIYGDKKEPITVTLNANTINVEYNKGHMFTTVCEIELEGENHRVLARDVQAHPVRDTVQHVDFLRVTDKTKIAINIPVQFTNEEDSPGLVDNGSLNIVRFDVELLCRAKNIPEYIEVSLAGKEHGDAVKMSDADLPEGTKPIIDDRDFTIATILAPKSLEALEAELALDEDDGIERDEDVAEGEEGDAAEGEDAKGDDDAKDKKEESSE